MNHKSITGMQDLLWPEVKAWQAVEAQARQIFHAYSFDEIRTPILEETKLFERGIGSETGVVQKEMYTFEDKGGDSITLRPEGTASIVRAYIENHLEQRDAVVKLFYGGPMFRYERPQKGRLRQFHQIGCELLGSMEPASDVEVISLLYQFVTQLGLKDFRLEINSLGRKSSRQNYLTALKNYLDKYSHQMKEDDLRRLATNPLRVLDSKDENLAKIIQDAPVIINFLSDEDLAHWEAVQEGLTRLNVAYQVNPKIVRGLDYYEQTAFELISDNLGAQNAFAGGGRYNGLVKDLGGADVAGVGFAIGMERLMLLVNQVVPPLVKGGEGGIYFCWMGKQAQLETQKLIHALRTKGQRADAGFEEKSLKSQMRRANKLGFRFAVILGENELNSGHAQVKDLLENTQKEIPLGELFSEFPSLDGRGSGGGEIS